MTGQLTEADNSDRVLELNSLVSIAKRRIADATGPLAVGAPGPLIRGPVARLVSRQLSRDLGAANSKRQQRARRAIDRLVCGNHAGRALLVAKAVAGHPREVEVLETAVGRHPTSVGLRLRLAEVFLRSGDRSLAGAHVNAIFASDLSVDGDETRLLTVSIVAGDSMAISSAAEALERAGRADPGEVQGLHALTALLRGETKQDLSDLGRLSTNAVRDVVRGLLSAGDMTRLGAVMGALAPNQLDPWTARHAAVALRRHGDLTISTELARRVLKDRPDDRTAARLVEVGVSGISVLRGGWQAPDGAPRAYSASQRTLGYLLHNSLPYASAGYATRTHGLLRALASRGWDVHAATRLGYPYDSWKEPRGTKVQAVDVLDGVSYHRLLDGERPYLKWPLGEYLDQYVAKVEGLARRHDLEIIHAASNYWNGLAAVTAARRLGLPSIYEVRGLWELTRLSRQPGYERTEMYRLTAELEAESCHGADHVLAITEALKSEMVSRGVPAEKITVLPNGVDSSRFSPQPRSEDLAGELRLNDKVVIGYVGSILDYEGIDVLLQAAAILRGSRRDFHLLVVGDGAALPEMVAASHRLGITDCVTFTGRVPHELVEQYYTLIDIAPFPRKPLPVCEAVSPLKPFEAMAAGKVPVVSSVAALTEIIHDGQTGLVFEKGSAPSLADALDRLVGDQALRERLGRAARDWVVQERDWSVLVNRLVGVYETVTA